MPKVIIKTKQVEIPIYSVRVTFIYSNSYDAIVKYAEKDDLDEATIKLIASKDYEGFHIPLIDKDNIKDYYLIVKRNTNKYEEVDTITHEISHLVVDILSSAGVKFSVRNDEPYAYLTGYLNKEFFKFKEGK